jgi:hypothetical protein
MVQAMQYFQLKNPSASEVTILAGTRGIWRIHNREGLGTDAVKCEFLFGNAVPAEYQFRVQCTLDSA